MIEIKNVSKTYETGATGVQALRDVSLKIASGEFVAIIGPSGSGKSTLLHILGFLDRPDSGSYTLFGRETAKLKDDELAILRSNMVGFVFQQFHLLSRATALENVELPLIYAGKYKLKEKAREKISDVGLSKRGLHRPNELSGGEQQRVAIARSLVNDPMIILADEPTGNLDTKSEEEIISILNNLNKIGKTIIMVTHEKEIADNANRTIIMRDGRIISDERKDSKPRQGGSAPSGAGLDNILSETHLSVSRVEFISHFRQAFHAILSHKMRSFLSMLGILIGVAAVIAMLALGEGATESIRQRLASLGSNLLLLRPGSHRLRGVALEAGAVTRFTMQDAEATARLPQISAASASVRGGVRIIYGNKNWNTSAQGEGVEYERMRASTPVAGRFFDQEELRMRKRVVLLGTTVAKELFGDANPVGATVKINRINFQVIGVMPEKGASHWHDQDDFVIIPITTAMYRVLGKDYVDSINIEVKDSSLMEEAQEQIRKLIIKRKGLKEDDEDSFQIRNMAEIQETIESTTKTMGMLLGSIAAVSLLVGGIGIMNIMLVSVTERTREIGLRKALGARARDIMAQFLVESVVMAVSGGLIGIMSGIGIAVLLSIFAGWATRVSAFSVVLATTFSAAAGIGFGLWPAYQASKLDPIQALRYE